MSKLDEADFLLCTFNDINPEDLEAVIETFNGFLDGDCRDKRVTEVMFDGCEDVNVLCDDGSHVEACSETTMQEIIDDLLG